MRIAVFLLLAIPAMAQTAYLVHWQTTEKCYECNERYTVVCLNGSTGCNVPNKQVDRYTPFKSLDEVVGFVNSGFVEKQETRNLSSFYVYSPAPAVNSLIAVYAVREVKVKRTEYVEQIPQPSKSVTRVRIEVEK